VLLYSTRNLTQHVARCHRYEFENVIAEADNVHLVAPRRLAERSEGRAVRYIKKILRYNDPLIDGEIRVNKDYDLFFAVVRPGDIKYMRSIKGLHERCRKLVCLFDELWPDDMPRLSRSDFEFMRGFDYIFSSHASGANAAKQLIQRPSQFMPAGVDALGFCPYPARPRRSIDVFSMGRRPAGLHHALLACSEQDGLFYVYDTASIYTVVDPREHRHLLSNTIKRSRYFIAYPAKFDEGVSHVELGNRYFDGAAGGAVLIGQGGANTPYDRYFDWPDAVWSTPADGSQIAELIADLDRQPERLARIRRDGVVNTLLRHDWVYRWRQVLETVDLPVSHGILEREERLNQLADLVNKESLCAESIG
jgi:Glycosyl transferases group 1